MDIFIILYQDTYVTEEMNYEAKSPWIFVLITRMPESLSFLHPNIVPLHGQSQERNP